MRGEGDDLQKVPERGTVMVKGGIDMAKSTHAASLVGRVWPIRKSPDGPPGNRIVVGRSAGNDLVIPEFSISQAHCELIASGSTVTIADLESLNGTWLSDERIKPKKPHPLENATVVALGRYEFEFLMPKAFVQRVLARISDQEDEELW